MGRRAKAEEYLSQAADIAKERGFETLRSAVARLRQTVALLCT